VVTVSAQSTQHRSLLAALVAVLTLGVSGTAVSAGNGATYTPPYADGPAGGGPGSFMQRHADGRMVVGRVYPVPGVINCAGGGTFAKFEVPHTLTGPVSSVTATFTDAAVDQFVFAVLSVRDEDGDWLDTTQRRGPFLLDGELTVELDEHLFGEDGLGPSDVLTIQFGLEMASACPHANGGTVRFVHIEVS
jgi:hypothetical protein